MRRLILLAIPLFIVLSCKKYVYCENAEVCVRNAGSDTIWCAWNSSLYNIKLAPGESTCSKVGEINTNPRNGTRKIIYFNSDHGNYALEVQECNQKHDIK